MGSDLAPWLLLLSTISSFRDVINCSSDRTGGSDICRSSLQAGTIPRTLSSQWYVRTRANTRSLFRVLCCQKHLMFSYQPVIIVLLQWKLLMKPSRVGGTQKNSFSQNEFSISISKFCRIFFITGRNEVLAKVMLLHMCVILFTGGGVPDQAPPPGTRQVHPPPPQDQAGTPPRDQVGIPLDQRGTPQD